MKEVHIDNFPKNDEKIVKKSMFNTLIISIIIITGIAAFFAGSYISNLNSEQISQKELEDALTKLAKDIGIDIEHKYSDEVGL